MGKKKGKKKLGKKKEIKTKGDAQAGAAPQPKADSMTATSVVDETGALDEKTLRHHLEHISRLKPGSAAFNQALEILNNPRQRKKLLGITKKLTAQYSPEEKKEIARRVAEGKATLQQSVTQVDPEKQIAEKIAAFKKAKEALEPYGNALVKTLKSEGVRKDLQENPELVILKTLPRTYLVHENDVLINDIQRINTFCLHNKSTAITNPHLALKEIIDLSIALESESSQTFLKELFAANTIIHIPLKTYLDLVAGPFSIDNRFETTTQVGTVSYSKECFDTVLDVFKSFVFSQNEELCNSYIDIIVEQYCKDRAPDIPPPIQHFALCFARALEESNIEEAKKVWGAFKIVDKKLAERSNQTRETIMDTFEAEKLLEHLIEKGVSREVLDFASKRLASLHGIKSERGKKIIELVRPRVNLDEFFEKFELSPKDIKNVRIDTLNGFSRSGNLKNIKEWGIGIYCNKKFGYTESGHNATVSRKELEEMVKIIKTCATEGKSTTIPDYENRIGAAERKAQGERNGEYLSVANLSSELQEYKDSFLNLKAFTGSLNSFLSSNKSISEWAAENKDKAAAVTENEVAATPVVDSGVVTEDMAAAAAAVMTAVAAVDAVVDRAKTSPAAEPAAGDEVVSEGEAVAAAAAGSAVTESAAAAAADVDEPSPVVITNRDEAAGSAVTDGGAAAAARSVNPEDDDVPELEPSDEVEAAQAEFEEARSLLKEYRANFIGTWEDRRELEQAFSTKLFNAKQRLQELGAAPPEFQENPKTRAQERTIENLQKENKFLQKTIEDFKSNKDSQGEIRGLEENLQKAANEIRTLKKDLTSKEKRITKDQLARKKQEDTHQATIKKLREVNKELKREKSETQAELKKSKTAGKDKSKDVKNAELEAKIAGLIKSHKEELQKRERDANQATKEAEEVALTRNEIAQSRAKKFEEEKDGAVAAQAEAERKLANLIQEQKRTQKSPEQERGDKAAANEIFRLTSELSNAQAKAAKDAAMISELNAELSDAKAEATTFAKKMLDYQQLADDLSRENIILEQKVLQLEQNPNSAEGGPDQISAANAKIRSLEAALTAEQHKFFGLNQKFNSEKTRATDYINHLNEESRQKIEALNAEIARRDRALTTQEAQIVALEEDLGNVKQELGVANSEAIENKKSLRASFAREKEGMESRNKELEQQVKELKDQIAQLETELEKSKSGARVSASGDGAKAGIAEAIRNAVDGAVKQVKEKSKARITELKNEITQKDGEIKELSNNLQDLTQEFANQAVQYATADSRSPSPTKFNEVDHQRLMDRIAELEEQAVGATYESSIDLDDTGGSDHDPISNITLNEEGEAEIQHPRHGALVALSEANYLRLKEVKGIVITQAKTIKHLEGEMADLQQLVEKTEMERGRENIQSLFGSALEGREEVFDDYGTNPSPEPQSFDGQSSSAPGRRYVPPHARESGRAPDTSPRNERKGDVTQLSWNAHGVGHQGGHP